MQHIFDIHDYDESFLEQFTSQSIPIYSLWSIRPLQNEQREIVSGTSEEVDKFRNFINDHASKEYPHPLVIVIGNAEKSNPKNMSNTSKKYFKLKFEKFKGNDLGTPLPFGYESKYQTGNEQLLPLGFAGLGQRNNQGGMQGVSYSDIQGIVDRNVSDATRSIKAQYEESSAKREADVIKKFAELEMKMELYKLDMREREISNKERKLQEDMDDLEERKTEGLGSLKDYTRTIAGGLLEVGKSAFGIEDKDFHKSKEPKKENGNDLKGSSSSANFDDDGFVEKGNENDDRSNQFEDLLGMISNLNEDQKYALLDVLMPDDIESQQEQTPSEPEIIQESTNTSIKSNKSENNEEI
ncbi:MAG: hypothetical protein PHW82_12945 [Bacteroidales bacterium]|nr:hypothetical protein [Bacteroidales bacterium]